MARRQKPLVAGAAAAASELSSSQLSHTVCNVLKLSAQRLKTFIGVDRTVGAGAGGNDLHCKS